MPICLHHITPQPLIPFLVHVADRYLLVMGRNTKEKRVCLSQMIGTRETLTEILRNVLTPSVVCRTSTIVERRKKDGEHVLLSNSSKLTKNSTSSKVRDL